MACSVFSYAQGLGDYMEIDGVPGFVFYLDESGEHGLVMSFPAVSEKQMKKVVKSAKKRGFSEDEVREKQGRILIKASSNPKNLKNRGKFYPELIEYLSGDGEQNATAIADFCKEKELDIQEYFPANYWASQLGEGWFIPGKDELNKFAEFYLGGTGKESKVKMGTFLKSSKDLSSDVQTQDALLSIAWSGILSSSMEDEKYGFIGLVRYSKSGAFGVSGEWFELTDRVVVEKALAGMVSLKNTVERGVNVRTVAIHKF